jgi:hypothetical protein
MARTPVTEYQDVEYGFLFGQNRHLASARLLFVDTPVEIEAGFDEVGYYDKEKYTSDNQSFFHTDSDIPLYRASPDFSLCN